MNTFKCPLALALCKHFFIIQTNTKFSVNRQFSDNLNYVRVKLLLIGLKMVILGVRAQ